MGILKSHRDSLAVLARKLQAYSGAIRTAGFSCCHIREDWIAENCTEQDVAIHQRYLREYAEEAIASDAPADILFEDAENCRSEWLNDLKRKRLMQFGPIEQLLKLDGKRSLIELSPCLAMLTKLGESTDTASLEQDSSLTASFIERRDGELESHGAAIAQLSSQMSLGRDETSLQHFYAKCLTDEFANLGARKTSTIQMYGPAEAVSVSFQPELEFVLLPSITTSEAPPAPASSGKVGMGFRITRTATLRSPEFKRDDYIVVNLHNLLPTKFIDYGRFNRPEELCLNILAWIAAMRTVLPDILEVLKKR